MSAIYPENPGAPLRTFVSADSGQPVYTEFTGAVTAGQQVNGTARTLTNQRNGVMVNVSGLADDYDVEAVYALWTGAPGVLTPGSAYLSLEKIKAGGITAWIASPLARSWEGATQFHVGVKFRNARAAVTIKSQEWAY